MRRLVAGGTLVCEGLRFEGSLVTEDDRITEVKAGRETPRGGFDETVDASDCLVLPGVIDSHVHFREPGMTEKADIGSESAAAAAGGVTTFFDMPNTEPQTVTGEELERKFRLGREKSLVNYSFFPGATASNADFLLSLDKSRVPGIKLFMGASTGDMAVEGRENLERVFAAAAETGLVLVAHCEDTAVVRRNMELYKNELCTDDPDISYHPLIRSREACAASSRLGAELAAKYGARLHIAHISTRDELALLGGNVTGEVCVPHLLFDSRDYESLGARIKCNPAVKTPGDRAALIKAVKDGLVTTIATDHAPHLEREKTGGAAAALSGIPTVQFSLAAVLTLADEENIPYETVVRLMCHGPAKLFGLKGRGFLRTGYKADVTIVRRQTWTPGKKDILGKCGWSPLEGRRLSWRVTHTIVNGRAVYENGNFRPGRPGREAEFSGR